MFCFIEAVTLFKGFGHVTTLSMASEITRLPLISPTCTQDFRPRNTTLRTLTGLGCFTCSPSDRLIGEEYNHPTVFAEQPLLTGNDQLH